MVNEEGYKNLKNFIDNKELGKLKLELEFNSGHIHAPKKLHLYPKEKINL